MEKSSKIYVAGSTGMVGSAIVRKLRQEGYRNIIAIPSSDLDLREQKAVRAFFAKEKPNYVFLAAAKVGGVYANNTYPAEFLFDNLLIQCNVIHAAHEYSTKKLLFLGSSCAYPKMAPQPLKEECLLTGSLEPTNEAYAIAKIAGVALCKFYRKQYGSDFISAMPTNLYGPNDTYDLNNSHVIPALLKKFHEAKEKNQAQVVIWGTGKPLREFLYVDDLAEACLFLMEHYSEEQHINVGTGEEITILDLALMIKEIVGYKGEITHDLSKPDSTPRKLLDVSKISTLGWRFSMPLRQGISKVYAAYCERA